MKLIPLSKQGKNKGKYFAQVDDEDYDFLMQWNWQVSKAYKNIFYAVRSNVGSSNKTYMHRVIMGLEIGDTRVVDHINNNGLFCQKYNMRICSREQNNKNRRAALKTSKYLGVHIATTKRNGKEWKYIRGAISINGAAKSLGHFKTEIEAARAYDIKAKELYGEFANLNFPQELAVG